eukprot:732127-Prymnesium_polylepis.2
MEHLPAAGEPPGLNGRALSRSRRWAASDERAVAIVRLHAKPEGGLRAATERLVGHAHRCGERRDDVGGVRLKDDVREPAARWVAGQRRRRRECQEHGEHGLREHVLALDG